MKEIKFVQLKAAILMVVFALNTIVGFACVVGVDMGFNSHHHDEAIESSHKHSHEHDASHHQDHDMMVHHEKDSKDNCCNDKVTKIVQADKALPQSQIFPDAQFFTAFVSFFYHINVLAVSQTESDIKYFIRSHPPPISDIRIAIQSFQI